MKKQFAAATIAIFTTVLSGRGQTVVNASVAITGLSATQDPNNQINFGANGGTGEAGPQRSSNGFIDANNARSAQTFVEFEVTTGLKTAAASGTAASLSFSLTGITNTAVSAPSLPDLSLMLLASQSALLTSGSNLASLWNAGSNGGNGTNLWSAPVATGVTSASTGLISQTVVTTITGADLTQLFSTIGSTNVGEYVTVGFYAGLTDARAIAGTNREVYEFSSAPASFALSVTSAIPEPSTYAAIFGVLALGAAGVRGHRRRRQLAA